MSTTVNETLTQTYNAYNSPRGLKEDAELTHVGRGTPGGEYIAASGSPSL